MAEEEGAEKKSEVMRRRNDLGDDRTLRFPLAHTQQDTHTHTHTHTHTQLDTCHVKRWMGHKLSH